MVVLDTLRSTLIARVAHLSAAFAIDSLLFMLRYGNSSLLDVSAADILPSSTSLVADFNSTALVHRASAFLSSRNDFKQRSEVAGENDRTGVTPGWWDSHCTLSPTVDREDRAAHQVVVGRKIS